MVVGRDGLDSLIGVLARRGYRTVGPVVRDGAITPGPVRGADDLPEGWHDEQTPGSYRLRHDGDRSLFAWAVGAASFKAEFFPPSELIWTTATTDGESAIAEPPVPEDPVAIIGARPCELAALEVLDRTLRSGRVVDPRYASRRSTAFVLVAECASPAATCFCTSMGTGPGAGGGFDIALTELASTDPPGYLLRAGSAAGAEVLAEVGRLSSARRAEAPDEAERTSALGAAANRMQRTLDADQVPALLARNLEHPRWEEVATRCLACGNCTLVCPTCFCSAIEDTTSIDGTAQRNRRWASCFDLAHSNLHSGPVRSSTRSRYRQWLTHKLSTWHDQFGVSGCVGCGRCITWCPVGIDLTEEVAAIQASDGAVPVRVLAGGGRP